MPDDRETELAEMFGHVARALLAQPDVEATLDKIVGLAVQTIDSCEHAGITMVHHGAVSSAASSDDVPAILDAIESETGEGPCIDAIREHEVFHTGCLSAESRWPSFSRRATDESGVESVVAFRLFADEDTMGALNLYSTVPDAFDDNDVALGAVFATHAAVAWSTSHTIQSLRHGMDSRQVIGQAVGLLMARQHVGEDEAFDMLRRASQRLNVKLRAVAERIVHTEEEPGARE